MNNRFLHTCIATALLLGTAVASHAQGIEYTLEIAASGTLDGTSFTNADVLLTYTGNLSNLTSDGLPIDTATVTVAGVGSDTFTDSTRIYMGRDLNFVDDTNSFAVASFSIFPYDLTTAVGPVSGVGTVSTYATYNMSGGTLHFTDTAYSATFTAAFVSSAVPEPSALAMVAGMGLTGAGFLIRRRTK